MGKPHILAVAYPAQGHVIPMMELVLCLSKHGFKITFVNTESIHKRVMSAFSVGDYAGEMINFVAIPDGMEPWEDRGDLGRLTETMLQVMPGKLEELIEEKRGIDDDEITCIIADENAGWALGVAEKMGIKRAAFWPAAAAMLGLLFRIQELIQNKILDTDGSILKCHKFTLSPGMPIMSTEIFAAFSGTNAGKILFDSVVYNNKVVKGADWIICNTSAELEPEALSLFPEISPIGPLMASSRSGESAGHLWPVDATCISWLDQQPACSVIYAAFGSFTLFDIDQLQELAQGLEMTDRPFLWVVRPDMTNEKIKTYLEEFEAKIQNRGRIIGLGLSKGETGLITREEISSKVEQLLRDKSFRKRALLYKEKAVNSIQKGGGSDKNMSNFVKWISSGTEMCKP
ncbi:hypothetical protein ACET3Z_011230 [Daucus carota]